MPLGLLFFSSEWVAFLLPAANGSSSSGTAHCTALHLQVGTRTREETKQKRRQQQKEWIMTVFAPERERDHRELGRSAFFAFVSEYVLILLARCRLIDTPSPPPPKTDRSPSGFGSPDRWLSCRRAERRGWSYLLQLRQVLSRGFAQASKMTRTG